MRIIAHRGASAYRLENSIEAFELAVEQRAEMLELDVRRTGAGELVVVHDAWVTPRDGGRRARVAKRSAAELQALGPLGCCPLLEEVVRRFAARVPINVEVKELEAAWPAAELLRRLASRPEQILISSFEVGVIELAARELSELPRALVVKRVPRRAEAELERLGATWLHLDRRYCGVRQVERLHRAGVGVQVYTVDEPAELRRLRDAGVDGVFTNRPDLARRVLEA